MAHIESFKVEKVSTILFATKMKNYLKDYSKDAYDMLSKEYFKTNANYMENMNNYFKSIDDSVKDIYDKLDGIKSFLSEELDNEKIISLAKTVNSQYNAIVAFSKKVNATKNSIYGQNNKIINNNQFTPFINKNQLSHYFNQTQSYLESEVKEAKSLFYDLNKDFLDLESTYKVYRGLEKLNSYSTNYDKAKLNNDNVTTSYDIAYYCVYSIRYAKEFCLSDDTYNEILTKREIDSNIYNDAFNALINDANILLKSNPEIIVQTFIPICEDILNNKNEDFNKDLLEDLYRGMSQTLNEIDSKHLHNDEIKATIKKIKNMYNLCNPTTKSNNLSSQKRSK